MDGLDVLTPVRMNAVIAVGDSITDGTNTTADGYNRWTDALQRRLNDAAPERQMVVLNGAIGANRLLVDAPFFMGESAISRLRWDIATNAGVTDVILHEGTNDIGIRSARNSRAIINGLKRFAAEAHNLGLRVFVTTIAPAEIDTYGDRRAIRIRNAVNQWIRNSAAAAFDGVFDFAASIANPLNRNMLAPPYDSGDTLHVSDLGQERLANTVDVNALSGSPCLAS
jgi:lysophospholipase L1-like esterase